MPFMTVLRVLYCEQLLEFGFFCYSREIDAWSCQACLRKMQRNSFQIWRSNPFRLAKNICVSHLIIKGNCRLLWMSPN
jgi:hypothetical protein